MKTNPAGGRRARAATWRAWVLAAGGWMAVLAGRAADPAPPDVVLETARLRYVISGDARNRSFVDRASGRDWLRAGTTAACASVRVAGKDHAADRARLEGGRLELGFAGTAATAVLRVEDRTNHLGLAVEAVGGADMESLTFVNVPLGLTGTRADPFAACVHALNLKTRVDALPVLQTDLRASCEKAYGLTGARVALVGAPMPEILPVMQQVLEGASELPVCRVAGPWAHEVPFNHGSYLFNFGALVETNVTDWVEMTRSLGFTQVDHHGGGEFFRFGDFELNRAKWPGGWDTMGRIVGRLRESGIGSIFHTYAFFIDKRSRYVTPVPDPRLDAFRTFTLAAPLAADATELEVRESTAGMTTVTGFFEHNSVLLHVGDELISFAGLSPSAPWRFTGLRRGAHGTKAAAHAAGARARHLKECFGLLVPDVDTTLFEEIAANHADVVNRGGFAGLYLDAIDGSSILRGGDACWYWANRFVVAIQRRLERPTGMEMSAMWHQFWQYRTRWQAWDLPQRGHRRFVDQHARDVNGGLLLPLHLGWWDFQAFNPPQIEPSYPDVMENLGARLIGWDAGISLTGGVNRKALRETPLFRRAVETLRTCEELRHGKAFDESVRARLREPGSEFVLVREADGGKPRFRQARSQARTVAPGEPWSLAWRLTNTFAPQPVRLRIEALMGAGSDSNPPPAAELVPTGGFPGAAWQPSSANGVGIAASPASETLEAGSGPWLVLTNAGVVPRTAAWARWERRYPQPLDLRDRQGLEVEIEADGSGALLAIRLESPRHLAFGALGDRYVDLDFTGRRRFVLVETESTRWSDYTWNDGKGLYNAYRETIDFKAIESVGVWVQNLAPARQSRVRVGPVRAIPLRATTLRNPRLEVGGEVLEFPIELGSGGWIEANGPDDCTAYGPKGELLGRVTPKGRWPEWRGETRFGFGCEDGAAPGAAGPRGRVTVVALGELL